MTDLPPDRLNPDEHACPVEGCGLSAEEHHRLGRGTRALMDELREARRPLSGTALSEKEALERVAGVLDEYRDRPAYVNFAIAALVLDALRWPRSDGTVPDA